ncbi:SbcC/MukB-like Walker B domain-containing protein [Motiliproteus sp. SC1-56]|uniref:SbcC/MukB-like Walker B domain-containing protein n=1 Tax=Motiliproteus sp. SC1-56 TaxID=2799565 RepID=UPI001A8C9A7F|nr:SbcC/MukB-like Walker B domain-containing protein [Motiliproteus sp. SC1-56]
MKSLNKIVLVNWYVLGAVEIPIRGNVAIVGPNGSGKSSLLDAIQTVMVGGNKRFLSFNASAGQKSERSLRTYCLGFLDDSTAKTNNAREDSITYLALEFKDDESGRVDTVGLAISASLASPEEEVEGRFILPDTEVTLDDFTTQTDGGRLPRAWLEVRDHLRARCPEMLLEKRSSRFLREVMSVLSHDANLPIDEEKFLKNFRNAIKFTPIDSPTRFVREYVLDHKLVQVGDFRKSLEEYRAMEAKTKEVSGRIEELEKVQELCQGVHRNARNAIEYEWVVHETRFEEADLKKESIEEKLEEDKEKEASLQAEADKLEAELNRLMQQLADTRAELNNSDSAARIKELELKIDAKGHELGVVRDKIQSVYNLLRSTVGFAHHEKQLPSAFMDLVKEGVELWREGENLMNGVWPLEPIKVDNCLEQMKKQIDNVRLEVSRQFEGSVIELSSLREKLQGHQGAIEQLKAGRAPLKRNTQELMKILAEYGIDSTPLCELTEIVDDRWRVAIESFLGNRREALIVDPDRVKDAITLYRRRARHLKGCRIVNTTKSDHWLDRAKKGSLAEFVDCDNSHALAYINRTLGGVMAVETEAELLRQERALTPDCMLQSEGTTTAIHEQNPMMGIKHRQSQLARQDQDFDRLRAKFAEQEKEHEALNGLKENLIRLTAALAGVTEKTYALANQREMLDAEVEGYRQAITDLRNQDDTGIQQRLSTLVEEQTNAQTEHQKCLDQLRTLRTKMIKGEANLEVLEQELEEHGKARAQCEEKPEFDANAAQEKRDYLEESCAGELERIIFEAARKAQNELTLVEKKKNSVRDGVAQYKARYHGSGSSHGDLDAITPDSTHLDLEAFVGKTVEALRQTELAHYTQKAERARIEAETAFRSDFVAHLNDQIDKIKELIRELNNHLKHRPFHKEMYSFTMTPNPELKDILKLVETYSRIDQANAGGLFDATVDQDSPHREALEKIHDVLKDEGESSILQDYRNFYNFELVIKDLDGNIKTNLSQRIKTGSGGEHQVPFYVAIAAGMGATYRLKMTPDGRPQGGISLSMFDEAFNKLDAENTQTSLGFMGDLGLQTLIAAPDDKYSLMASTMDTVINVCRDGAIVDLDVEFPMPKAKALLNSDNPYRKDRGEVEGDSETEEEAEAV